MLHKTLSVLRSTIPIRYCATALFPTAR